MIGIYKKTAKDIMTRRADTARLDEKLKDVITRMIELGLSAMPVVDEQRNCVGLLSKTDIVRLAGRLATEPAGPRDMRGIFFGVGLEEVTDAYVEDVMARGVICVAEEDAVTKVVDIMLNKEIHHVPVCNAHNAVVGIVSSMDVLKAIRDR